jgi:hypothetical protein
MQIAIRIFSPSSLGVWMTCLRRDTTPHATVEVGNFGVAITEYRGESEAGDFGVAVSGWGGWSSTGKGGVSITFCDRFFSGYARSGVGGTLQFGPIVIPVDGVAAKPDVWYEYKQGKLRKVDRKPC